MKTSEARLMVDVDIFQSVLGSLHELSITGCHKASSGAQLSLEKQDPSTNGSQRTEMGEQIRLSTNIIAV